MSLGVQITKLITLFSGCLFFPHEVSTIFKLKLICYGKVSGEEQIKDLLRKKNFKEAISLVDELEDDGEMTKEMLSFVHAQVGFLLLFDLHFKEAIDHFLLSEYMQPSELFPFIMPDPNRWTLLVRANLFCALCFLGSITCFCFVPWYLYRTLYHIGHI